MSQVRVRAGTPANLRRSSSKMGAITASLRDGTLTLTALVDLILHAPEYDARINPAA